MSTANNRSAASSTAQPDKQASSGSTQRSTGALALEQIKLNIGDTLQLQFQSESETSRCVVTLIGYLADYGVFVTTPVLNGSVMLIREGQDFCGRLFSGKTAYAFTAEADKITHTPYPHMHLSYPKEVRGSSRARANITAMRQRRKARAIPASRATSA